MKEYEMQAAVWTGAGVIEMKEMEVPSVPAGEVLIKVNAVGICGSELSGYLGHNSLRVPPLVMGHEFSGTIENVASDVTAFKPGDRVTVNPMIPDRSCVMCRAGYENLCLNRTLIGAHRPGAFAGFVTAPEVAVYRLPGSIDDLTGTLVEPLACAIRANELAQVGPGSTVVIEGAGPIGLLSLLVARASGASTIVISDLVEERLDFARSWGATHAVNPAKTDVVQLAKDVTGGLGVDAVIDAVGLPITRKTGVLAVRPGGRVIFIGLHEDESSIPGNLIVRSEITVQGAFCYTQANFSASIRMLASGFLKADETWVEIRPLDQTDESFRQLIETPSAAAKIVLRP
jgi:threonine dehydrogenase-like Zn-dependent dehydrogenase